MPAILATQEAEIRRIMVAISLLTQVVFLNVLKPLNTFHMPNTPDTVHLKTQRSSPIRKEVGNDHNRHTAIHFH
jgi:hypothetical protein